MDERSLLEQARAVDPDRSLCALFAPPRIRAEILGLILLDHELSRIPLIVTQPLAGMIRFQWWRDALASLTQDGPLSVPALAALAPAVRRGAIALGDLGALIDAREHELDEVPPADLAALEIYLASTAGAVSRLMACCLGAGAQDLSAAAGIGTAWGLVRIARAFTDEAQGRDVRTEATALLDRAEVLLSTARQQVGRPSRDQLAPFLLARIAKMQSAAFRRCLGDARGIPPLPSMTAAALLWGWATRRV